MRFCLYQETHQSIRRTTSLALHGLCRLPGRTLRLLTAFRSDGRQRPLQPLATQAQRFICPLALFFLFAQTASAASLFFTEDEAASIEEEIARRPQAFLVRDSGRLSLESVFYYDRDRWALWIDGEKWTPETRKASIEILDVAPDKVSLRILPPRAASAKEAVLRAYQSLDLATGEVFEGR